MQTDFDSSFFSSNNPLAERVAGTPSGSAQQFQYVVIERHGRGSAKIKGGSDNSMYKCGIHISKTDWPVVCKNEDVFIIPYNGTDKAMRVTSVLYEDSYSFKLALI